MKQILAFGASITYGAWDTEGGWVQRLRRYLDVRDFEMGTLNSHFVFNLGVSGDTTGDLIDRFESDLVFRVELNEGIIVLLAIGVNDSIVNNDNHKLNTTAEQFKEIYTALIKLAKKYTKEIIAIGSMPVDEEKVDPIPWLKGYSYKNDRVFEFNRIMEQVAKEQEVGFIDFFEKFSKQNYKILLVDGVHPNNHGHQMIYENIKTHLLEKNII